MIRLLLLSILLSTITNWSVGQEENTDFDAKRLGIYDEDLLPASFHAERRQALRDKMPDGSVAVLFAAPLKTRSNDILYQYHQNPDFYYFSGLKEPHAMLLVFKEEYYFDTLRTNEILFIQESNPDLEKWEGRHLGTEGASKLLKIETIQSNETFDRFKFPSSLRHIYFSYPPEDVISREEEIDLKFLIDRFIEKVNKVPEKGDYKKLDDWISELREIKTAAEIEMLRKAIQITCDAHNEVMKLMTPGIKEYQVQAAAEFMFAKEGAQYPGFPTIVGSGENSCILHYSTNRKTIHEDDMVVVDMGAEYHGYTADITRTLPANGTFSEEQAAIYNLVLEAQEKAIEASRAGEKFKHSHQITFDVIAAGLKKLGVIETERDAFQYFFHGTSHYLGLDVHDVGQYQRLKPGNVITIEPGIYISENSPCDPKWWNIGIRIEDNVLITEEEPEVLSSCTPKTIVEIEMLMEEESSLIRYINN